MSWIPVEVVGAGRRRRRKSGRGGGRGGAQDDVRRLRARERKLVAALRACRGDLRARGADASADADEIESPEPLQGTPGWLGTAFGAVRWPTGKVGRRWGPSVQPSPNVSVRAREGTRVVWSKAADGLTVFAEVPEAIIERSVQLGYSEIGFINLIAKGAVATVKAVSEGARAAKQGGNAGEVAKAAGGGLVNALVPGLVRGRHAAPAVDDGVGCDRCGRCGCGR